MNGEEISEKKVQEENPIKILETIFRIYADTKITFAKEIKCIWDEEQGAFSVYSETKRETGGSSTTG